MVAYLDDATRFSTGFRMEPKRNEASPDAMQRDATRQYILDMIRELAILARKARDPVVAILLESILAARHATAEDRDA